MGSRFCVLIIYGILLGTKCDSTEDHQFAYNHAYAPTAVNFHDIYPHGPAMLAEDGTTADEDFHLNTISTQFVEFHPQVLKIQPITPPPRVILNSSYLKTDENDTDDSTTHSPTNVTAPTTTAEPDELPIKVVPVKHFQRGVLDLLLPPSRVRTFKSVFDSFRRMLSYTFRRR